MRAKILLTLLVVPLCIALVITAQLQLDRSRAKNLEGELLYLPSAKLLQHCTAGMNSVIADLLWLRCVQYVAKENQGAAEFTWLEKMLHTVVELDPNFVDAYHYGGIFLSSLRADDKAAFAFLEQGMLENPWAWELPYEAAMIHMIRSRVDKHAEKEAAFYLGLAVGTGNAPGRAQEMATLLQNRHNLTDIERTMWTDILETGDQMMQDLARRKLLEVDLRETCVVLNERLQRVVSQGQSRPTLAALGLETTEDVFGGRFFIDADGTVQNSTLLDNEVTRWVRILNDTLKRYREKEGAFPARLEMLEESQIMVKLPEHPYAGERWPYNPETGTIESAR